MAYSDNRTGYREMMAQAKESFIEGDYRTAEPLLQQAILQNNKDPEVYQMLATLFYDKGQFNKAIKSFKKALEIDPSYTDASVGLSIILNDLGRYEEAKEVFEEAQERLNETKMQSDPFIEDRITQKHMELGDLYLQIEKFEDALEQFMKAKKLSNNPGLLILKIAECFMKIHKEQRAIQELQLFLRDYPQNIEARVRLGVYLYQMNRVYEAVEEWEKVQMRDSQNADAKHYLQLARETRLTEIALDSHLSHNNDQEY
ncbi:MAG: tetratricopeptide repeat protein [Bdellovibrionota bacterium]